MRKRVKEKGTWPQIPGVDAHLRRTGEAAPFRWSETPCDMVSHGGYCAVGADGRTLGPFCWIENATHAADEIPGGRVVRAIHAAKVAATLTEASRLEKKRALWRQWRNQPANQERERQRMREYRQNAKHQQHIAAR